MKIRMTALLLLMLTVMNTASAAGLDWSERESDYASAVNRIQTNGQYMTGMEAQVIGDVNAERMRYGLKPLKIDPQLTEAARIRAQEIARKFSHTRPDGTKWSTVSSAAKGENIARGHNSADRVMAAWMSSSGHRANILRERFGSIGVCALRVNGLIYWVQIFGR